MSILLSGYYPEGIVFAADKAVTIRKVYLRTQHVEFSATKVIQWPSKNAVVGFVDLGSLSGIDTDEWMRRFVNETDGFTNIDEIAFTLKDRIQDAFETDYHANDDFDNKRLIIHLGGFVLRDGIHTPIMYHLWNHGTIHPRNGYPPGERNFRISEDIERDFRRQSNFDKYPEMVQTWLQNMVNQGQYQWYNNGANLVAFNTFKEVLWRAIGKLQEAEFAPGASGLESKAAFCRMAVEVFGAFFSNYFPPEEQIVGGGADVASIPWPV